MKQGIQQNDCVIRVYDDHVLCRFTSVTNKVAKAAVRYKAVALLLLMCCFTRVSQK